MEKKVITKAMQKAFVNEYLQTQIFIYMRNKQNHDSFQKGKVLWGQTRSSTPKNASTG